MPAQSSDDPVCDVTGCDQPAPGMMRLCSRHAAEYDETGQVPGPLTP